MGTNAGSGSSSMTSSKKDGSGGTFVYFPWPWRTWLRTCCLPPQSTWLFSIQPSLVLSCLVLSCLSNPDALS